MWCGRFCDPLSSLTDVLLIIQDGALYNFEGVVNVMGQSYFFENTAVDVSYTGTIGEWAT